MSNCDGGGLGDDDGTGGGGDADDERADDDFDLDDRGDETAIRDRGLGGDLDDDILFLIQPSVLLL